MAKLKYEFEHRYYQTHARPWRDYAFGYFHITAALAASIAPLTNALLKMGWFRHLVAQVLGITPRRRFPEFQNRPVVPAVVTNPDKRVIFLSDPFARYVEPDTELAALSVLARCGYEVQVLPILGAGASLLSKGMLDAAKRHAWKVLEALDQLDPTREASILGIEPPEIYCLKHDYYDLLPGSAKVIASRAARTWLLDEFLLRSDEFTSLRVGKMGDANLASAEASRTVHFHPHCHQRAEGLSADGLPTGIQATVELLRACGYVVEVSAAGCCGMAGTFGYEAEHYELSMQIGELKLFPRLRGLKSESHGTAVVSTGAACRMQIRQGVESEAIHPVQLIEKFLNG